MICRRPRTGARLSAISLALALAACELNPLAEETVTVSLPDSIPVVDLVAPGADLRWTVVWRDCSGEPRTVAHARGTIRIAVDRGALTPIIAIPETSTFGIPDSFLPRAGAIYPDACEAVTGGADACGPDARETEETLLRADWEGGVCAEVAETVIARARGGIDEGRTIARHFNWRRLKTTLESTPLPNHVDRRRLADAILSLETTKRDVTAGKLADLGEATVSAALAAARVPAGDADFLPEWPPDADRHDAAPGNPVRVANGVTRFFARAGYLTVIASNGSVRECFFSTYVLQD